MIFVYSLACTLIASIPTTTALFEHESVEQLLHWCVLSPRCSVAYHTSSASAGGKPDSELFEYLLRIRLGPHQNETWHQTLLRHYAVKDPRSPLLVDVESLRLHWTTLMVAAAPHCFPCDDALSADIGVQCDTAAHQLKFDIRSKTLRCINTTVAAARLRSRRVAAIGVADEEMPEEETQSHWHTPWLANVSISFASFCFSLAMCTRTCYFSRRIMEQNARRAKSMTRKR